MNAYGLEDEEDVETGLGLGSMEGGVPNVPRNPDAEDPREKIKQYLSRQEGLSRLRADPEFRAADRASTEALRGSDRDLALMNLFQKSANQIGTIGGKAASSAPLDQYTQRLMQGNQAALGDIMRQRQEATADEDRQLKIRQYMADKMMSDKQRAAALREKSEARKATEDYRKDVLGLQKEKLDLEKSQAPGATPGSERTLTDQNKPMSDQQLKSQSDLDRMNASAKIMDELSTAEDFNPENVASVQKRMENWRSLKNIPLIGGVMGPVAETAISGVGGSGGALQQLTPSERQYLNEVQNFIAGKLRKESGATISDSEFRTEYERYFPVAGDSPETIEAKKQARNREIQARRTETGKLNQFVYGEEKRSESQTKMGMGTGDGTNTQPVTAGAITGQPLEAEPAINREPLPGERAAKIKDYMKKKKGLSSP